MGQPDSRSVLPQMSFLALSLSEVGMRNPFVAGVGGVLSADIAVPEHERELSFYSRILTTGNAPSGVMI